MAKAAQSAEPSMEDILASIRRIISDDADGPGSKAAPTPAPAPDDDDERISEEDLDKLFSSAADPEPEPEPEAEVEEEVLDLGAMAEVEEEEPLELVEGLMPEESDIAFAEFQPAPPPKPVVEPEPVPEPVRPAAKAASRPEPRRAPPPPPPVDEEEPLVSDSAGAAVNAAFGQLTHTILSANAKTLDDLVKEMLRPMLKGWLDENLPAIVERLVRAEIERVSRGR